MKKTVWVCGLIAGVISILGFLYHMSQGHEAFSNSMGMALGYASMLLAFSLIFVAIRNYRDRHNGGVISFGKAFRIGLYVTLIASTVYVLIWMIDFSFFNPDFMEQYTRATVSEMRSSGSTEAEVAKFIEENREMSELYNNNIFVRIGFTYIEILPVGLLVSLIAALILRRRPKVEEGQKVQQVENSRV